MEYWVKQLEKEFANDNNPTKEAIILHVKRLEENNKEFSKAKRYITQLEKRIRELESFIQNWHETDGE